VEQQSPKLTTLGKYHLIASLAEGGMAKVYLGLMAGPAGFNKLLVIKVLKGGETAGSEEDLQLFWDEARLAARVIHPNVVHTYEVGEVDGRYFLAMEYLDGQSYRTLQNRMPNHGLPLCEELRIVSETARGLHYAHELKDFKGEPLGVVHRDVSPQNVFVTYDGQVKLLDFGIAKTYDAVYKTKVGVIKGKLDYISPEQLSGDSVDHRADIFALGVLLWEAVTGARFAGGRTVAEVAKIHTRLTGGEAKVREVKPDLPEALALIIDRAIALEPAQRWPDAGALADALDAYIESTGSRPGAKSLSEVMNATFAEERRKMHKLIDQQIEAAANQAPDGTTGSLPQLGVRNTITPSGMRETVDPSLDGGSGHGMPVSAQPAQPAASHRRVLGVAIALAVAALLAVMWLVPRDPSDPRVNDVSSVASVKEPPAAQAPAGPSEVPKAPEPAPSAQPPDASAKATVIINLRTLPVDARVTLDGAEVPAPFSGEFLRGTELHHLEATAQGYEPYKKFIDYSRDQSIEIVLQEAQVSRSRRGSGRGRRNDSPSVPAAVQPVAPPPVPAPAPGARIEVVKPRIKPAEIDVANPYVKQK
jgi:eukaryotic-like serine/threonine-protein kinase